MFHLSLRVLYDYGWVLTNDEFLAQPETYKVNR